MNRWNDARLRVWLRKLLAWVKWRAWVPAKIRARGLYHIVCGLYRIVRAWVRDPWNQTHLIVFGAIAPVAILTLYWRAV